MTSTPQGSFRSLIGVWQILLIWLLSSSSVSLIASGERACFGLVNYAPAYGLDAPVRDGTGVLLDGGRYKAMLYWSTGATNLLPVDPVVSFLSGARGGYLGPAGSLVVIDELPGGSDVFLQLRAWDAWLGASYEEVAQRQLGGYGESEVFLARSGCCFQCGPGLLIGLGTFSLRPMTGSYVVIVRREVAAGVLTLEWISSEKRFQVQESDEVAGPWRNLGEPTTQFTYTGPASGSARFFRVVGLPE